MIDALIKEGEIDLVSAGGGRGNSARYCLKPYLLKGEHGSSIECEKGEPEIYEVKPIKGEPECIKGEPGDVKGEQAVPPNHQEPSKNRQKKEKEEVPEVEIPVSLNTTEFRTAWTEYLGHRRDNKFSPLKPRSISAQFRKMETWGVVTAIEAIEDTIRNNYQGIFPPKTNQAHNGQKPKKETPYDW